MRKDWLPERDNISYYFIRYLLLRKIHIEEQSGSRVDLRTLNHEYPGSNTVLRCETLDTFSHSTLRQSTQLYEYHLAIDSGGYLYKQHSRTNCSMAGCFTEKLRWCLIEQVCQGSKV